MPIIVLNMGSEMVYILNQRLQAQSIQEEKSKKVYYLFFCRYDHYIKDRVCNSGSPRRHESHVLFTFRSGKL